MLPVTAWMFVSPFPNSDVGTSSLWSGIRRWRLLGSNWVLNEVVRVDPMMGCILFFFLKKKTNIY